MLPRLRTSQPRDLSIAHAVAERSSQAFTCAGRVCHGDACGGHVGERAGAATITHGWALSDYLRTVCSAVDCGKERRQGRRCAMGRPRKVRPDWNAMATIWTISDELWSVIAPILAEVGPAKTTGRPRVDARRTLDAIIVRMRSA